MYISFRIFFSSIDKLEKPLVKIRMFGFIELFEDDTKRPVQLTFLSVKIPTTSLSSTMNVSLDINIVIICLGYSVVFFLS